MLVGRKRERATIRALIEGAARGDGGALVVLGEPGIGKTVLLDDAAAGASGFTVLRAAGLESTSELPFVDLGELFRPVEANIDLLPRPQAAMLRGALAVEGTGAVVDHLAVGVATLGLLAALALRRPVLVVVDDLQWVDAPSRAALSFVARRLTRMHVALLVAARSGELAEADNLPSLDVGALRPREASELLGASLRGPIDRDVRRRLLEVAQGNPLALVEMPSALSAEQLAGEVSLGEPIPVNGGIERTFGARVARLPERTRRALLIAAVAGEDARASVLDALSADGLEIADFDPAVADGLVVAVDEAVVFRHALVRSVVYSGATDLARAATHELLVEVERDPDRRAWHRAAASTAPDEAVAKELDAAAERALARGAPASAARAFAESARRSVYDEQRGRRLARAARAAHRAGDVASASRYAKAAREVSSDPIARADLLLVESDLRMRAGDLEGAHRALVVQAESVISVDPRRAATMLLLAAKLRIYRLEAPQALAEVERALAVLPEDQLDLIHLVALSMSHTVAGTGDARDLARAAADAAARSPHGHAHTLGIAWPLTWLEEYDLAREVTDRAIAVQRESGFLLYLPQSLMPRAELDFRTGRWDAALQHCSEALALFEETRQPSEAAAAAALLARIEAARGHADECRSLAQRALASDVEFGLRSSAAYAVAALGFLALGMRAPKDAIAPLETAERIAASGSVGEPWLLLSTPDLVEALAHVGNAALARDVLRGFEARIEDRGRLSAEAAARRCAGILSEDGRWRDAFEQALALHDLVPTPFERARTELCYGERLRRTRRRAEAREWLRRAAETFDALGAHPWSERARAELRASGERARKRSAPVDTLTEQERAVARLVVGGATNREAAAALFVSAKTIEFHLGHVYRKLGVRSRMHLARSYPEL